MRKITIKSVFLMAALAMGATGAWAQTTTLYERGTTDANAWTAENLFDFTASSGTYELTEHGAQLTSKNATVSASKQIAPTANAIINVEATWLGMSSTGRNYAAGNASYFRFGNIYIMENDQDKSSAYVLNGETPQGATTFAGPTGWRSYDAATRPFYIIKMEINTATNVLNYLRVYSSANAETALLDITNQQLTNFDYTTVAFGYIKSGSVSTNQVEILKSVKITQTTQDVTTKDYTINYMYNGETLKTAEGTLPVDATIDAETAITVDGVKYLSVEVAPSLTITDEGPNVLNVEVRQPYTATLSVTTVVGGDSETAVTNLVETDDKSVAWSYAYPLYVKKDGAYYKADETATFGEGGNFADGQTINKTVTYSTADADVVFFADAKTVAGTKYQYSNGADGNVAAQNARDRGISVGTLAAGAYEFVVNITAANKRSLVIRQSTNDPLAGVGTSTSDMATGIKSAVFVLDSETESLWINGANSGEVKTNQSEEFDYVLIKKYATSVDATITSAGYATFSSSYALDFSGVTDLKAYVASSLTVDGAVVMTRVEGAVPANTGLLLKGSSASIPVVASATAPAANFLVATVAEAPVAASTDGAYNYMLANGDNGLGFYKVETATTSAAGKAYLQTTTALGEASGTKTVKMIFSDGAVTGISEINSAAATVDGVYYNLNGVRVQNPAKGLYILNGKKVMK